ncbi:MAG TPA: hypothetical protein VKG26_15145 [Bacteroidia bacterium]|nr:hypothetical protein [Bacteroidia bacterium]
MKTKAIKFFTASVAVTTLLLTGCKKGDTGPAGAPGTPGVVATSTDGFIKGTFSGTRRDGTAFTETFNFQNYWGTPSGTLDSTGVANFTFSITRGVDIFGTNSASISINTTSVTASTGFITLSNFSFTQSMGTNKEFQFLTTSNVNSTATALSYDKNSGMFTGNFTINVGGSQNNTGNAATITGSFQATITQLYYFVKPTGTPNGTIVKD